MNDEIPDEKKPLDFIRQRVKEDLDAGRLPEGVITRFPPEPNGYLHIGHAKAICISYGIAEDFNGRYHLRFDDTNPEAEETEYVESIQRDIRWLGFDWGEHLYFASDYFQQMYDYAVQLIREGKAYVCDLTPEQFKEYRGVPTEPGSLSPNRDRSIEENLRLFQEMKEGKHADGTLVLRAKIDMSSPNLHLRDPAMYRIKKVHHHRTGDDWFIYPMYDWAHGLEDSIEGITHSLCSLEFEVHRPLYDWFLDQLPVHHPKQIEFARLNLGFTVMSKRKLLQLVQDGEVDGWDDPRMPTLSGLRRRGCPPEAIRAFCDEVGITKYESQTDVALLEYAMRNALNAHAERRMAVVHPLKLVITNYPEDEEENFEAVNHPADPGRGTRQVPFSRELWIEREDFMEDPPKKFFRLGPGREVRLRAACYVTCTEVVKDAEGEVIEVHGTFDPESRGGTTPDKRKVKGTIHWVSAKHAVPAEIRLYDRLFNVEKPDGDREMDFKSHLNPASLTTVTGYVEPSLRTALPGDRFQFERVGYFCADKSHTQEEPVYNRTVTLRDSWANKE